MDALRRLFARSTDTVAPVAAAEPTTAPAAPSASSVAIPTTSSEAAPQAPAASTTTPSAAKPRATEARRLIAADPAKLEVWRCQKALHDKTKQYHAQCQVRVISSFFTAAQR